MMYRPMPYPPPIDATWTRSIAPWDGGGGRPGRPWSDGGPLVNRGPNGDGWTGDFVPNEGWRDWGMRGPTAPLSPSDFAPPAPSGDASTNRIVEQLSHCSIALKRCGDRLTRAATDSERRQASIDGYGAVSYLLGVLSTQGISLPSPVLGESAAETSGTTRGNACKEAGDFIDRMLDKYTRGTRGVFGDIGEGADKLGGCYRELRDNVSK